MDDNNIQTLKESQNEWGFKLLEFESALALALGSIRMFPVRGATPLAVVAAVVLFIIAKGLLLFLRLRSTKLDISDHWLGRAAVEELEFDKLAARF